MLLPVFFKELRTQLRGNRAAFLLTTYVGLLLLALVWLYRSVVSQVDVGVPLISAQIGQALFTGLALAMQALLVFMAPATTVNAVSSEYERQTIDLLLRTPLSAAQLLLGKLVTALAFVGILLLATLPLFSAVVLFGGVEPIDIYRVLLTVVVSAMMGCVLGLFCSVITRQTYAATIICYALLITVIGGTLFAANLWSVTHALAPAPASYVVANPLSAMAATLGSARPPEMITADTLRPLAILGLLTHGTVIQSGGDVTVLPVYRATWLLYGGAMLGLVWFCLHAIQPRRPWRVNQVDGVMLALVLAYALLVWISRDWFLPGLGVEI